jgi:hypothetical protein
LQEGIYILFYALLQCKGILVEGREGQWYVEAPTLIGIKTQQE